MWLFTFSMFVVVVAGGHEVSVSENMLVTEVSGVEG
jgi:hypothetical protein